MAMIYPDPNFCPAIRMGTVLQGGETSSWWPQGFRAPSENCNDSVSTTPSISLSSNWREGGLGLGLALVEHIVRVHGGAVPFANRSRGAKVMIYLPIR